MQPTLSVVRPSGFTPTRTPPPLFELHYALHSEADGAFLWLSDARAGNLAEAWVRVGPGGPLCVGAPSWPARELISPLAIECSAPRELCSLDQHPRVQWTGRPDSSAVLRTTSLALATSTLIARVSEILESVGAPCLTALESQQLSTTLPADQIRRLTLHRGTHTWRLTLETREESKLLTTDAWIANDHSGWRTNWAW